MSIKLVMVLIAFILGLALGSYSHPYEKCERKGTPPDHLAECVWLLENQPALR